MGSLPNSSKTLWNDFRKSAVRSRSIRQKSGWRALKVSQMEKTVYLSYPCAVCVIPSIPRYCPFTSEYREGWMAVW